MIKYIFFLSFIGLIGCGFEKSSNYLGAEIPIIDISNSKKASNIFDIIKEIECVHIMSQNNTFGMIDDGSKMGDNYLFTDSKYYGNIVIVSPDGKIVQSLNNLDNGPSGYKELTSIKYDSSKKLLKVHDFQKQEILNYDAQGNYLHRDQIGFNFFEYFETSAGSSFLFTAKHSNVINEELMNYDLLEVVNGEVLTKKIRFNQENFQTKRIHSQKVFLTNQTETLFNDMFLDTIFSYSDNSWSAEYTFKYGEKIDDKLTENGHEELIDEMQHNVDYFKGKSFGAFATGANSENIIFAYNESLVYNYAVFNRNSGNIRSIPFNFTEQGFFKLLSPFFVEDDRFVTVIPSFVLEHLFAESNRSNQSLVLIRKLKEAINLSDPEAPIIIKYSIQEF